MTRLPVLLAALLFASPALPDAAKPAAAPIEQSINVSANADSLVKFMAVPVAVWSNGRIFVQWMLVPAHAFADMPAVASAAPALVAPVKSVAAAVTTASDAVADAPGTAAAAVVKAVGKLTGSTATHARSMAATCNSCHGTDGKSHSAIPSLAGLEAGYFVEQMKDFKSGKREATVMHQHAKAYTDEEIQQMADVFAAVKP